MFFKKPKLEFRQVCIFCKEPLVFKKISEKLVAFGTIMIGTGNYISNLAIIIEDKRGKKTKRIGCGVCDKCYGRLPK